MAHVNDVIDSSRLVEFTGGLLLIHGIGAAIGPVLAGVVMDVAGPSSLMLYYTAVMGSLALVCAQALQGSAGGDADRREGRLRAHGRGSQAVLQMDPRTEAVDAAATDNGEATEPSQTDKPLP